MINISFFIVITPLLEDKKQVPPRSSRGSRYIRIIAVFGCFYKVIKPPFILLYVLYRQKFTIFRQYFRVLNVPFQMIAGIISGG